MLCFLGGKGVAVKDLILVLAHAEGQQGPDPGPC